MKLKLTDFLVYRSLDISFDDKGVYLIVGNNGVGKSTLIEAVVWALFGRTIRAGGTEKLTGSVQVEFEDNKGRNIAVRRQKKKTGTETLSIYVDGQDVSYKALRDTQALLESLVGSPEAFLHTQVYSADGLTFASMTDGEKKEVLRNLLHLEYFDVARKFVSDDLSAKRAEKHLTETTLNLQETRRNELLARLDQLKEVIRTKQELKSGFEQRLAELNSKRDALLKQKQELTNNVDELTDELELIQEKLLSEEAGASILKSELASVEKEILMLKNRENEIQKNIQRLSGKSICPVCNQPIPQGVNPTTLWGSELREISLRLAELETKRNDIADTLLKQEERLKLLRSIRAETASELNSQKTKLRSIEVSLESVEADLKALETEKSTVDTDIVSTERVIETVSADLQKVEVELANLRNSIALITNEIQALEVLYQTFGPSGVSSWMMGSFLTQLERSVNRYLKLLGGIEVRILPLEEKKTGGIRDKVSIVPSVGGGKISMVSGGEKRRIDTALLLGLRDLVSSGIKFPVFFDEVFDRLDEEGAEAVAEIISDYATYSEVPVIVIAHNKEVQSLFPAARMFEVFRGKDGAEIREL